MSLENELKKNTAAIQELTAVLQGGAAPAAQPASQPAKPAENKPAKPAKAAENKQPAGPAKPPAEAPTDEATGLTLNDLGAKFMALCKEKGRDAAFAILGEYGASKVPDLAKQQDKFPEIIAKIDAKLAG